jgi:non-ribosomal peptide synthetase component F
VIREHRVTTAVIVTSLFNALVDESPKCLEGLREILVGGEALSAAHIRLAQRALPGAEFVNVYGPTETTVIATCYRIPRPLTEDVRQVSIGRPIANTSAHVLNDRGEPVGIGVEGELWLGGDALAREIEGHERRYAREEHSDALGRIADAIRTRYDLTDAHDVLAPTADTERCTT